MNSENIDTKWQIQMIFIYYTSYADRNNFRLLKQQNYRRFLIDSQTVVKEASFVHYDIAFQKISHSAIVFKDFLNLIPDIAQIIYKKRTRSQAFKKYLNKNIKPLYQEIMNKSQFGHDVKIIMSNKIDRQLKNKLQKSSPLQKVFDQYIGNSAMHSKQLIKVFQNFSTFLKEFEISPQIISKSISYIVLIFVLKEKQKQDHTFTYQDFVECLILISQVTWKKMFQSDLCSSGKITKLFERMEISPGFQKLSKKILFETGTTPSLLKNIVNLQIQTDHCLQKVDHEYEINFPQSTRHRNCNQNLSNFSSSRKEKARQFQNQSFQSIQKHEKEVLGRDLKQLKKRFEEMCSYGEVANSKTLKSFKIKKLYQRTGLMKLVDNAWLDIQIVNLLRTSETGKVQFFQFLELISLTANKLNVSFDEMIELILKDRQYEEEEESPKKVSLNREENERQTQILKSIVKPVQKIFKHYSNDKSTMTFSEFSKVMYDFQIFPTVISKSRLFKIFSHFSEMSENEKKTKQRIFTEEKLINIQGFLLSFIDISIQICEDSLEPNQKLIILIQKMNESKACRKLGTTGSLVSEIRHKFADYYEKSFRKQQTHIKNFDELMETLS